MRVLRYRLRRRSGGAGAGAVGRSSGTVELKSGDVVRMLTPGGGGWGESEEVRTELA